MGTGSLATLIWPLDPLTPPRRDTEMELQRTVPQCSELRNEVYFDENKFCFERLPGIGFK